MIAAMPNVHPSAIIDPQAQIADDVTVGPGCVIEGPVQIGPGTVLMHRVSLKGPLAIGARNTFYPNVIIGYAPQHRGISPDAPSTGVAIGDDNIFREGVTINAATKETPTAIGSRNYMMANSHIGHDSVIDNDVTMANGVLLGGHVHVASNAFLGGNCAVHQFCRVGRLAMIGGVTANVKDVPPFCVVHDSRRVGALNMVGLRRAGLRQHLPALKQAFGVLYFEKHTLGRAAEIIEETLSDDPLCLELARFIRESRRGICHYGGNRDLEAEPV